MTNSLHSDRYREMLEVLTRARAEAGITQSELAAKLGKPQSYVSKVERGERRIDVIEFGLIARALKRRASDLFATLGLDH